VSIVALIQLAILTVACLEESDRDHIDKGRVIDQLVEDLATHAWQQLDEKDRIEEKFTKKEFGRYLVYCVIGLENMHEKDEPTSRELYAYLRPAIEMNLAWGIPTEKPSLSAVVKGVKNSQLKKPVLDYFAYLFSIEKNKSDQIKMDRISKMVGIFSGISTLTLIASWLLSRFARKYYRLAKPAQDHARTEPLMDFITTVFPIITFKTTRWDALKFMKSQFRRRVTLAILVICFTYPALSECQQRYKDLRVRELINQRLDRESVNVDAAKYLASAESNFHQSILAAFVLALVMGTLFIVPKHLSRQDTDKGIAPTPAG
jgi:hypothetical protein